MGTKDALTELLDDEIEGWEEEVKELQGMIPADDLDEDDIEDKDSDVDDDKGVEDTTDDEDDVPVSELKRQLDEIEKQRRGLYKELKSERRTRQEMGGQLQHLTQAVSQILQQRQAATKNDEPETIQGITFDFNDDGEAVIPKEKLTALTKPLEDEIATLRRQLESTTNHLGQQQAAQEAIQKIVSEDERYGEVWPIYRQARAWAEEQVNEWMRDNNVRGVITSGQAMSHIFDQDLHEEFAQKFPGIPLEQIVTAEDGDYFLKRTLRNLSDIILKEDEPEDIIPKQKRKDDRFTKVLQKPNGLGASANKGAKAASILSTAEDLSSLDALELSDAQVDALERALLKEEQVGGITF